MQRADRDRVLGPYRQKSKWRVLLVRRDGTRVARVVESEEEARRLMAALERMLAREASITVASAIDQYRDHLIHAKGNKVRSVDRTVERLRLFFPPDEELGDLTVDRCRTLYEELRSKKSPVTETLYAVATQQATVIESRTFLKWCCGKGWMRANPLEKVELVGRRCTGKQQLRVDEAKKLVAVCDRAADSGDPGAVVVLVGLLLGLRAGETVHLRVRDIDDDGRLLWVAQGVEEAKTRASRRSVSVPALVRRHLLRLAAGRPGHELLFGQHWRDWPRLVTETLCRRAGVPVVTFHGLRGTHATLAIRAGLSPQLVAQALGHESARTTLGSYASPGSAETERAARVTARLTDDHREDE
jgi:integrase